jgi:hypothetical protein
VQIATLAKIPTLVVFADNLPVLTGLGGITWQNRLDGCRAYLRGSGARYWNMARCNTAEHAVSSDNIT